MRRYERKVQIFFKFNLASKNEEAIPELGSPRSLCGIRSMSGAQDNLKNRVGYRAWRISVTETCADCSGGYRDGGVDYSRGVSYVA